MKNKEKRSLKRRGSNYERQLLKKLWEYGILGLRIAGSGSSSLPALDLIVGKNGKLVGIEVKSSKKDQIYIREEQLEELKTIKKVLKIPVYLAIKFHKLEWSFLPLESLENRRKINRDFISTHGIKLKDFISIFN